jgi:hypothetical protein
MEKRRSKMGSKEQKLPKEMGRNNKIEVVVHKFRRMAEYSRQYDGQGSRLSEKEKSRS